jgi:hypothetical protein
MNGTRQSAYTAKRPWYWYSAGSAAWVMHVIESEDGSAARATCAQRGMVVGQLRHARHDLHAHAVQCRTAGRVDPQTFPIAPTGWLGGWWAIWVLCGAFLVGASVVHALPGLARAARSRTGTRVR